MHVVTNVGEGDSLHARVRMQHLLEREVDDRHSVTTVVGREAVQERTIPLDYALDGRGHLRTDASRDADRRQNDLAPVIH